MVGRQRSHFLLHWEWRGHNQLLGKHWVNVWYGPRVQCPCFVCRACKYSAYSFFFEHILLFLAFINLILQIKKFMFVCVTTSTRITVILLDIKSRWHECVFWGQTVLSLLQSSMYQNRCDINYASSRFLTKWLYDCQGESDEVQND